MKFLILAAMLLATPVTAQELKPGDTWRGPGGLPCAKDTNVMAHMLDRDFHEYAIGIGWATTPIGTGVVQIYASKPGTWTMTLTVASGQTCIIQSGDGWNRIAVELPDPTRKAM